MPNQLVLHIQPEEGISLRFAAKVPGPVMRLGAVDMNFEYADYFGTQPSTGYERLLHDCMIGDATLFQRADMVEAGWCVVSPVLDVWKALPPRNFPNYAAGYLGSERSRRTAGTRRPPAGGISRNDPGRRHRRHQRTAGVLRCCWTAISAWFPHPFFPAGTTPGLDEIVAKFVDTVATFTQKRPASAWPARCATDAWKPPTCPGSSSPNVWPTNSRSSKALLINDLEANAWGIRRARCRGCGHPEPGEGAARWATRR